MITNREFIDVANRYEGAINCMDEVMKGMEGMVISYPYRRFTGENTDLMVVGVLERYYYDHDDHVPHFKFVYVNHETGLREARYLDWNDIRAEARW